MVPPGYNLIWNDEFDGSSLDLTKWSHRSLGPRGLGYVTESSIDVSGGTLKNIIHVENIDGIDVACSGMIGTQGKFETKYGYFEIRAKLPKIKGPQSAFWLQSPNYGQVLSDPYSSGMEIDIFEYVKISPTKIHFTTHWDGYVAYHKEDYAGIEYPNIEDDNFHTFGLLWTKDTYEFYVEDILMHTKKGIVSNTEQYIILSSVRARRGCGSRLQRQRECARLLRMVA